MIFILILINVYQYITYQIYNFEHLLEKCPTIYARSMYGSPGHHNRFCPGMPDCPFFCPRFALARTFLWAICPARDRNESLITKMNIKIFILNSNKNKRKIWNLKNLSVLWINSDKLLLYFDRFHVLWTIPILIPIVFHLSWITFKKNITHALLMSQTIIEIFNFSCHELL